MEDMSQQQTLTITYKLFESQNDLPKDEHDLVLEAREAMKTSYSPYSHFCVGCALKLKDGSIIRGSNQENVAYGPTNCAERSALFTIGSQGKKDQLRKMAVIARPENNLEKAVSIEQELPGTPCGICRQVIKEYESLSGEKTVILVVLNSDRVWRFEGIDSLLPFAFGPGALD